MRPHEKDQALAHRLAAGGAYQQALSVLHPLLSQYPHDAGLWLDIAHCHLELHEFARAQACLRRVVRLQPANKAAWFGLAVVAEAMADWSLGIKYYRQVLALDDKFTPALHNLGSLYLQLNMANEAYTLFEGMKRLNPTITNLLGFALAADQLGRSRMAVKAYRDILTLRPKTRHRGYIEARLTTLLKEQPRSRLVRVI